MYGSLFVEEVSPYGIPTLHPIDVKLEIKPLAGRKEFQPRIEYVATLSWVKSLIPSDRCTNLTIVGTGPTLEDFVDEIKTTDVICSINRAHEYLIQKGIIPDIHILYETDVELEKSLGGPPHQQVQYYVCSTCPQDVFDQLNAYDVVRWHTKIPSDDYYRFINDLFPGEPFIDGGPTTFLKAFAIGNALGYKNFNIYGIDCSFPFEGAPEHVDRDSDLEPDRINICARNNKNEFRRYRINQSMLVQVTEFIKYCSKNKDLKIKIYGDGLLGFVHG